MPKNQKRDNSELSLWLKKLETGHNKKIDLGLERIRKVIGSLQLGKIANTIITVAGTNGKGSTVAILNSICLQAGYSTGTFTSPHILKYNERICVGGIEVSDSEIVKAFNLIESHLNGVSLSYFEYSTLAAFVIFKNHNVDIAILEVGLGGRLDSVNSIDTDCAIITTVDIDHTAWLGDDTEAIGYEKAGIMRPDTPVVYGDDNCPQSIINHAKNINARLYFRNKNIEIKKINLPGDYQVINAQTAITALKLLKHLKISEKDIQNGLINIKLNGRLQTISESPHIIIDVSHNKQAAKSLAQWLKQNPIQGRTIAVFAVLDDKMPIKWLNYLSQHIDIWCVSQVNSERTMKRADLISILADSAQLIISASDVAGSLHNARLLADSGDRILVFGSFYTVSEALQSYES